jgi:hypothetical protein
MLRSIHLILLLFCILLSCGSKRGCLDPAAINYEADAILDDGSCYYNTVSRSPIKLTNINNQVKEPSGLAYDGERLWTINDKGGENKVYSIDINSGKTTETIILSNATNIDYEAMAFKKGFLYVGDIGNNDGDRRDLTIYKFKKPSPIEEYTSVNTEKITYKYPEQKDYKKVKKTEFDAEAMVVSKSSIYVFTKSHASERTVLYKIPDKAGNHNAEMKGIFHPGGLITDAAINEDESVIALLGHDKSNCFVWILSGFESGNFFSGKKVKINIGSFQDLGKVEGITFKNNEELFISSERTSTLSQSLYLLNLNNLLQ